MSATPVGALPDPDLERMLVALRRDIHAHPELSGREYETADRLERALRAVGVGDVTRVAGTGIVARVRGTDAGAPVVALRGDIDALPITEATGLPFASTTPGVMHACGHDMHATWSVGAAALLARKPARGDVLVVLQPAEETGNGARAIIESGALHGVSAIFGAHVDRRFPVGQVVADDGPLAASADVFTIDIIGRGAHAARPHEAADPIVAAAAVVTALQTIVARRLEPSTPGVVTVGAIHAGAAPNVIPDRATMTGTVRAVEPRSRKLMLDSVREVAEQVCAAHGVRAEVVIEEGPPPLVNPPWPTSVAREAASAIVGAANVVPLGLVNMAAEDFAEYLTTIPGTFLRIGAREPGGEFIAAHQPTFQAAEGAIPIGAAVLAECARRATAGAAP